MVKEGTAKMQLGSHFFQKAKLTYGGGFPFIDSAEIMDCWGFIVLNMLKKVTVGVLIYLKF